MRVDNLLSASLSRACTSRLRHVKRDDGEGEDVEDVDCNGMWNEGERNAHEGTLDDTVAPLVDALVGVVCDTRGYTEHSHATQAIGKWVSIQFHGLKVWVTLERWACPISTKLMSTRHSMRQETFP